MEENSVSYQAMMLSENLPGRAIKASAWRAISALRPCMSETDFNSPTVSPEICGQPSYYSNIRVHTINLRCS